MANLIVGVNDLATTHPALATEWHPTKNGTLTPCDVTAGSNMSVWWYLPYDDPRTGKTWPFEWEAPVKNRTSGRGCPYLSNKKIMPGFNDLATLRPDIAKEWHPTKNGDLTPEMVSPSSGKKVWWLIHYYDERTNKIWDFEWEAAPNDRVKGHGCPQLAGKKIVVGFNDLASVNPELASEWNNKRNRKLKPTDVAPNSTKKVWWIIKQRDKNGKLVAYEWQATVYHRMRGEGCPNIASSKGEMAVRKALESMNIKFEPEHTFEDRVYKASLRDDFAIFNKLGDVIGTIEYHGEQHYEAIDFSGKGMEDAEARLAETQMRDQMKTEYLRNRGIPQLIIPYTEFDNIESIVAEFVNQISGSVACDMAA